MTNYLCTYCGYQVNTKFIASDKVLLVDCPVCGDYEIDFDPAQFKMIVK